MEEDINSRSISESECDSEIGNNNTSKHHLTNQINIMIIK